MTELNRQISKAKTLCKNTRHDIIQMRSGESLPLPLVASLFTRVPYMPIDLTSLLGIQTHLTHTLVKSYSCIINGIHPVTLLGAKQLPYFEDIMHENPPLCHTFILRLWEDRPLESRANWRFRLEHTRGEQNRCFADLDDLIRHLRGLTQSQSEM